MCQFDTWDIVGWVGWGLTLAFNAWWGRRLAKLYKAGIDDAIHQAAEYLKSKERYNKLCAEVGTMMDDYSEHEKTLDNLSGTS